MIFEEEKYVISLMRGKDEYDLSKINFSRLLEILFEHKMFFYYFEKIKKDFPDHRNEINTYYSSFFIKRTKYNNRFKKIVNVLNNLNLKYCIYKGFALEKLIYDTNQRIYSDIDIVIVNEENINYFITAIYENFKVINDSRNEYSTVMGEIALLLEIDDFIILIEFKSKFHSLIIRDFNDLVELQNKEVKFYTFSTEISFLMLVKYYYSSMENITSIKYSNRCLFRYEIDIYNYIKKLYKKMNINVLINKCQEYEMLHEIRYTLINLYKIFFDDNIKEILEYFQIIKPTYTQSDILDTGRIHNPFSIFERHFNRQKYKEFILNYFEGDYVLGVANQNLIKDKRYKGQINNIDFTYKFFYKNEILEINFDNSDFFIENMVIYLNIFSYNTFDNYILPFTSIMIRKNKGKIITSKYIMPRSASKYDFAEESKTIIKKGIKIIEKKDLSILVDFKAIDNNINLFRRIGINFFLHILEKDTIINSYSNNKKQMNPLIIN